MQIEPQLLRQLIDEVPLALAVADALAADQPLVYVNPAFEALTGLRPGEPFGGNLQVPALEEAGGPRWLALRAALERGEACVATRSSRAEDGATLVQEFDLVALRDADGTLSHFAAIHRVGGGRREAAPAPPVVVPGSALLREDRLSGLLTRAYLEELLRRDWAVAQRERRSVTVLAIDIDALDLYNNTFGRAAGDSAIRRVGHCLAGCLRRASDAAARLEGGSFLAFATGLGAEQALRLGAILVERVRDLRIHHPRCAVLRYISVSVGVAHAVPATGQGAESLIQEARQHLQAAKQAGRNTVR